GKIMHDYHAARVLPGYDPDAKVQLLQHLRDKTEIILCVYAGDIERRKSHGDTGITYDDSSLKLIEDLKEQGLWVSTVVVTRNTDHPLVRSFAARAEGLGVRVVRHGATRGYPGDVETIVSDEGYGANPYIETSRPIVVVTGPGPGSGKLATCLSQLYHESRRGVRAGYAKFETFPVWHLPLKHPVNIAYEAATADMRDVNMIDPHYVEAHSGRIAVNYNRDIEAFPLLRAIWEKISRAPCPYASPTDMGVNRAWAGVVDEDAICAAARQEIVRRHFLYATDHIRGKCEEPTVERVAALMQSLGLSTADRRVVPAALKAAEECRREGKGYRNIFSAAAIELRDGRIITGKNSPGMHASASAVMNAIKTLAGIPDDIHLLPPHAMETILHMKADILKGRYASLNLDETLIALALASTMNTAAEAAMKKLRELRKCEMHLSHIPSNGDEAGLRRLVLRYTNEPVFATLDVCAAE
ncbi:MAG: DUF1846 domain-containing protein, partial [Kiritimatiellaeota bacterium]|nr:DUF1846 domain-containing protein [Kiritimatiellota bacterium]